ncbi:hypothetical protein BAE44_0006228, partial [Dichanthelium oligosanthes]
MPAYMTTVLTASSSSRSPARGAAPARTCRSIAVRRPSFPSRCRRGRGKKPNPGPTAPPLLLLPESSLPPWLDQCLHALAPAALALALSGSPLLPAAHAASFVGVRSPLDAAAYPCEDVWQALKILDAADAEHPEASSEVIEIYSQRAVPKILAGKPDGWNREHLWPRSYGLTYGPSLTNLHNIRPADVNGKSQKAWVIEFHYGNKGIDENERLISIWGSCEQLRDQPSKQSSSQEEYKNENTRDILEEKHEGRDNKDLNAVLKEDVSATKLKESVDETKLNEAVSETELNDAIYETKLKETD